MNEEEREFPSLNLEEILRRQLASFALSSEISRVVAQATGLAEVLQAIGLGFQELLGFNKVGVFALNAHDFSLRPIGGAGFSLHDAQNLRFGLEFFAGEYGDAIFRNRHVIVEDTPEEDAFRALGSTQYAVFPLVGRITDNCWETRQCACTQCPCFEKPGSVCWATEGAALFTGAHYEDERRRACTRCPQFKCLGILWLDLSQRPAITGDDVSIISPIALQAGLVIENFQMYEILRHKNEELLQSNTALEEAHRYIRRDLERAKTVQKKLLPARFPLSLRGVGSHYAAHSEIGGDYYDCFEISPGRLGMVVADVSGHGVSAALVMSIFKTLLKQIAPAIPSPSAVLRQINEIFLQEIHADLFVTVFYAIWDAHVGVLRWTNAGHPPILLLDQHTGECQELKSRGLFLGMFEDTKCTDDEITVPTQSRLLLYTDGILEATSMNKEQFGLERIKETLAETRTQDAPQLVQGLLQRLYTHIGNSPLDDDITLLCCDL